jgi:hypothetical protein
VSLEQGNTGGWDKDIAHGFSLDTICTNYRARITSYLYQPRELPGRSYGEKFLPTRLLQFRRRLQGQNGGSVGRKCRTNSSVDR